MGVMGDGAMGAMGRWGDGAMGAMGRMGAVVASGGARLVRSVCSFGPSPPHRHTRERPTVEVGVE